MSDTEKSKEALLAELRSLRQQVAELETGHRVRMGGIATDITERNRAEAALQASEQRMQARLAELEHLYSTTPVGLCLMDTELRYVHINEVLADFNGRPAADHIGRTLQEMIPDVFPFVESFFHQVLETGAPYRGIELRSGTQSEPNRVRDWLIDLYDYRSDDGVLRGVSVVLQDVTERKREQEREALITDLERRNAEMDRFTYTVSHDLKTPLMTINGFLGLLERDALAGDTERMKADIKTIFEATGTMHRLLEDLLELSRIGRVAKPSEAISLGELAREAVGLVAGQIAARGVAVEIDPAMPVVFGDRVQLLEVYQNLLENAVKYMGEEPAPRVEVGARREDGEVVCCVRDNGMGIDPKYHEKVFGLFERLDSQTEGTGIGLAIVKRVVEVHGGRIWVESEGEGHGSTFCFTLPNNSL